MKKKKETSIQTGYQFLSLLVSGLWKRPADITPFRVSGPDWKGILRLGKTQAVLPLIYDGMMTLPEEMQLKGEPLLRLIAYVDKVEQLNSGLDKAVLDISDRLAGAGIRSVLLKGQGNAALYPVPEHRQCGDIDLYTGAADYDRAAAMIRTWKETRGEHPESVKHIGFVIGNITLELHREAFRMPDAETDREYRILENAELAKDSCRVHIGDIAGGGEITVPVPNFNVFYIFCHAFHHFMQGGLGLRQMCDLAVLLHRHHGLMDEVLLRSRLETFRLDREWKLFVCLLVNALDLPSNEAPLYDPGYTSLSFSLLDEMFRDGNFGQYKDFPDFSRLPRLLRKAGSLWIHHVMFFRRLKFSRRQTWSYYRYMWKTGLEHAFR